MWRLLLLMVCVPGAQARNPVAICRHLSLGLPGTSRPVEHAPYSLRVEKVPRKTLLRVTISGRIYIDKFVLQARDRDDRISGRFLGGSAADKFSYLNCRKMARSAVYNLDKVGLRELSFIWSPGRGSAYKGEIQFKASVSHSSKNFWSDLTSDAAVFDSTGVHIIPMFNKLETNTEKSLETEENASTKEEEEDISPWVVSNKLNFPFGSRMEPKSFFKEGFLSEWESEMPPKEDAPKIEAPPSSSLYTLAKPTFIINEREEEDIPTTTLAAQDDLHDKVLKEILRRQRLELNKERKTVAPTTATKVPAKTEDSGRLHWSNINLPRSKNLFYENYFHSDKVTDNKENNVDTQKETIKVENAEKEAEKRKEGTVMNNKQSEIQNERTHRGQESAASQSNGNEKREEGVKESVRNESRNDQEKVDNENLNIRKIIKGDIDREGNNQREENEYRKTETVEKQTEEIEPVDNDEKVREERKTEERDESEKEEEEEEEEGGDAEEEEDEEDNEKDDDEEDDDDDGEDESHGDSSSSEEGGGIMFYYPFVRSTGKLNYGSSSEEHNGQSLFSKFFPLSLLKTLPSRLNYNGQDQNEDKLNTTQLYSSTQQNSYNVHQQSPSTVKRNAYAASKKKQAMKHFFDFWTSYLNFQENLKDFYLSMSDTTNDNETDSKTSASKNSEIQRVDQQQQDPFSARLVNPYLSGTHDNAQYYYRHNYESGRDTSKETNFGTFNQYQ